jgi:hypothetical protein
VKVDGEVVDRLHVCLGATHVCQAGKKAFARYAKSNNLMGLTANLEADRPPHFRRSRNGKLLEIKG